MNESIHDPVITIFTDLAAHLSHSQVKVLSGLIDGNTSIEAAKQGGVCHQTVSKWRRHDPWFQTAENRIRNELLGDALRKAQEGLGKAIDRLIHQIDHAESEKDQREAARLVLAVNGALSLRFKEGVGSENPKAVIETMSEAGTLNPASFGPEQAKEMAGKIASFMAKKQEVKMATN